MFYECTGCASSGKNGPCHGVLDWGVDICDFVAGEGLFNSGLKVCDGMFVEVCPGFNWHADKLRMCIVI